MPRHVASYALVAGVALSLTAGADAQSRDTLETKLTADGATILLEWSKKHPWHQELQSRGAALIAEYPDRVTRDRLRGRQRRRAPRTRRR